MRKDRSTQKHGNLHVAIIMDGNGRWAMRRSLPRTAGHKAGVEAIAPIVEAAPNFGINTLTLYAFSSDNWHRPTSEVEALMTLFESRLWAEAKRCQRNGVRLSVMGRRDRLAPSLRTAIEQAEALTIGGTTLHLRLAIDYSARDVILRAASLAASGFPVDREAFIRALGLASHTEPPAPDVDLVIRPGGEQRLSDFLLWESAYAELFFTDVMWPDFSPTHLATALDAFYRRNRRFGGLAATTSPTTVPTSST